MRGLRHAVPSELVAHAHFHPCTGLSSSTRRECCVSARVSTGVVVLSISAPDQVPLPLIAPQVVRALQEPCSRVEEGCQAAEGRRERGCSRCVPLARESSAATCATLEFCEHRPPPPPAADATVVESLAAKYQIQGFPTIKVGAYV